MGVGWGWGMGFTSLEVEPVCIRSKDKIRMGSVDWAEIDLGRKRAKVQNTDGKGAGVRSDTVCHQWEPGKAGRERLDSAG